MVVAVPGQRRKLEAILSADVVGYSRLMQDDDAATVETLTKYRAIFSDFVNRHEGRIVDSPGDNILAEFDSPVEAVQCAVELQREFARRNRQLAEHRQMQFRIGINLGDILSRDDGTIYGDGVNVAARLESLAEPGGIMISESAQRQVRTLIDVSMADAGEHEVKNIAEPVHVYRIVLDESAPKPKKPRNVTRTIISITGTAVLVIAILAAFVFRPVGEPQAPIPALPTGPSIAVLPFTNMSGDPQQEYFSDGITDTLITALSNLRDISVVARNSTFVYKGKPVDVRQAGRELGVRHVLEGSVQKAGGRIRINVQLVEAATGNHLWAEKYDREFDDVFALQDEIIQKILTELDVALVEGEQARSWRQTTQNPKAYELFLRGWEARLRITREDNALARNFFEKALELDPAFAAALVGLGASHYMDAYSGWGESSADSFEKAIALLNQAIELEPSFGFGYNLLGEMLIAYKRDFKEGLAHLRRAVALEPNSARYNRILGIHLCGFGRAEEGFDYIKRDFRLNPHPPPWAHEGRAFCNLMMGRYADAITSLRKCIALVPDFIFCRVELTLAYMELGRLNEAQVQANETLRINPNFSVEDSVVIAIVNNPATQEGFKMLLRQAGLP